MDEKIDILYSHLGVKEVVSHKGLEISYSLYMNSFRKMIFNIIEANNSEFFDFLYDRKHNIISRYRDFMRQFESFLNLNASLKKELKIRHFDERTLNLMNGFPLSNFYQVNYDEQLQLIGCSYLVVDRLWGIYKHFCDKQIVSNYAYEGCSLLGVKWTDLIDFVFNIIKGIITIPFNEVIWILKNGISAEGRPLAHRFGHLERVGAAFAEYPYDFQLNGCLRICSKDIIRNLDNADGMSVALFDYKVNKRTLHCLAFAGTRTRHKTLSQKYIMAQNLATDAFQFVSGPSKVYFAAVGILQAVMRSYPKNRIYVFGHSLGGGLAQFSAGAINSRKAVAYCYNSAGLSKYHEGLIEKRKTKGRLKSRICHICDQSDPVSYFGMLIPDNSVKYVKSDRSVGLLDHHKLSELNKKLNKGVELRVGV